MVDRKKERYRLRQQESKTWASRDCQQLLLVDFLQHYDIFCEGFWSFFG